MGVSDFLALMTAQLKNQDPFAPVDNSQMVAQMAQFSSLSGITEMSTTLKSIAGKLGATTLNDAIGYVGKNVLVQGSTAYPRTSGGLAGAVALDKDATNVTVTIKDKDGNTLKTIEMGKETKGAVAWDWDGKTDAGETAGNGPFNVSVTRHRRHRQRQGLSAGLGAGHRRLDGIRRQAGPHASGHRQRVHRRRLAGRLNPFPTE